MKRFLSQSVFFFAVFFSYTIIAQDTIHIPADYTTIQAGINAANNGDIVLVAEGTYIENINFRGKAITVASLFLIDDSTKHISNTIINGSQPSHPDSGSVVFFVSGEDTNSVLYGFTITGGTGTINGTMARTGGGIVCRNSSAKIMHNIIENNHVTSSTPKTGGGAIAGGPVGDISWIIIENNTIRNNSITNTAVSGEAYGGGIFLVENARVINNIIEFNTAQATYGGAYGGGASLIGLQTFERYVINNIIWHNKALSPTGTYYDGGLGGGLFVGGMPRAEIRLNDILYNEISSNTSLNIDCFGGGVFLMNQNEETIFDQNYVAFNKAINNSPCKGAGITIWNNDVIGGPYIINNIITNNTGGTWGGGVYTGGEIDNAAIFINNTICNDSATQGGAIYIGRDAANPSHPIIINSIMWNNSSSIYVNTGSSVTVAYSDVEGGYTGVGNINANPLFSDDTLFNLSDWSPCIGAGIDSIEIGGIWYYCPLYDYDGFPRLTQPGSMPDIGACENPLDHPLPVELISFTATSNGKEVILNWSTATELNNLGFEIQRSTKGEEFFSLGFIDGHGTTTEQQNYSYADRNLDDGKYYYRLKQVDYDGSYEYSDVVEVEWRAFNSYLLEQNYPNPFNPTTTIGFGLQNKSNVKITILNTIGEEVAVVLNEEVESGYHTVEFNAATLPSGVYFYQLKAGDFAETKKMLLLK